MLLDVTLRDGGFVNGFAADSAAMLKFIEYMAGVQVDVIELGYCGGLPTDHGGFSKAGPSLDLPPTLLRQLVDRNNRACSVMVHPAHPRPVDLKAIRDAGVALLRIPIRPREDEKSPWLLAAAARALGLRVSINLILMSWWSEGSIARATARAVDAGAEILYLADTNSAMVPQRVGELIAVARESGRGVPVGFHAHDGLRLALENANAAVVAGAEWVDTAMGGVGRGAGNLAHEVLLIARGLRREALVGLRALPIVRTIFGRPHEGEVWERLCGFLDLSPSCSAILDRIARECGKSPIEAAIELLLMPEVAHPLMEDDLRAFFCPVET